MFSWLEMLRPLNCAMSSVGVLVGGVLVAETLSLPLLIAAAAAFLIAGAGNSVNDVFDVESDRINRPRRPIPSGRMSKNLAAGLTLALFGAGILLAAWVSWLCFILAIVNSVLLVVYSFNLQHKILIGNLVVSYIVGSVFLFGGAALNDIVLPLMLAVLAFLANFAREVVKDLEDLEGDKVSFMKRAASKVRGAFAERFRMGKDGRIKLRYRTVYAILFAVFSLWMAVVISTLPYVWNILGLSYLALLIPTDAVFIAASYILIRGRRYALVSRLIKAGMAIGLAAFLAGIFI